MLCAADIAAAADDAALDAALRHSAFAADAADSYASAVLRCCRELPFSDAAACYAIAAAMLSAPADASDTPAPLCCQHAATPLRCQPDVLFIDAMPLITLPHDAAELPRQRHTPH